MIKAINVIKIERLKLHIWLWFIYIIYDRSLNIYFRGKIDNPLNYITFYGLNICLFYFNAHILMPTVTAVKKNRAVIVVLTLIGQLVAYMTLRFLIYHLTTLFKIDPYPVFLSNVNYFSNAMIRFAFYFSASIGYWFALSTYYNTKKIIYLEEAKLRDEIQAKTLEKALLTTENARLKAQINPHFLLNTLNFLYNSVSRYSEQVADSFLTLADIMRYALTAAAPDGKVLLEDELENIINFIRLNQARFNQRLQVRFEIDGDPAGLRIPPLILMTLAENVFKYGELLNENDPATISARIGGNMLTFKTQNSRKKNILKRSHGIGLKNIKSRLTDFDYDLKIDEGDERYIATLEINL